MRIDVLAARCCLQETADTQRRKSRGTQKDPSGYQAVAGDKVNGMTANPTPSPSGSDPALSVVDEWVDWSEASELLHVSVSKVRQLIREHHLAATVPVEGAGQKVPRALLQDGDVVKGVSGLLTVLHDAGYADREAIVWLFTADDTLPGRPIDALRENRGAEVKRRAQAMAF